MISTGRLWSEFRQERAERKEMFGVPSWIAHDLKRWPGLTAPNAYRIEVERGHYLSTLNSEKVANLAEEYAPILREALEELDYEDFRLVARSLPAIVEGFLNEHNRERFWRSEIGDQQELNPDELIKALRVLGAAERIGILDCAVAERHRRAVQGKEAE